MGDILSDTIEIDLQIGSFEDEDGNTQEIKWDVIQAKTELTQAAIPNYVDMIVTPQPQFTEQISNIINPDTPDDEFPNNGIGRLVGEPFELNVDNEFVAVESESDNPDEKTIAQKTTVSTETEEETLLFKGRLANISPIGNNLYEAIAYGPAQQNFNIGEESGSILNKKIIFSGTTKVVFPGEFADNPDEVEGDPPTDFTVNDLLNLVVEETGLGDVAEGETVGDTDIEQFGSDALLEFENAVVTVKAALNQAREITNSEWWFDKKGTFHFGDPTPDINNYRLELIKDTTAGMQSPPYQSVRVIGSGVASSDGWGSNSMEQDENNKIVKRVNIARPEGENPDKKPEDSDEVEEGGEVGSRAEKILVLDPNELQDPTFKYINAEISTDRQAQNTAIKIGNELIKQQASGKVTVVGLPEVQIFDGIRMPNTDSQPMGGRLYGVYKVVHKLNASDGFITEIEVAGPTPDQIREFGFRDEDDEETGAKIIPTSTERDVYTPDGKRRAFKSGAGEGE